MSDQRALFAAVLRYMDAQAKLASHRKEQNMNKEYPTALAVGDVLVSSTGREYTVTAVDTGKGQVSYAYVPYDATNNRVAIDTRDFKSLRWVKVVRNKKGQRVWPSMWPNEGDKVRYNGKEWKVTRKSGSYLDLQRVENKTGVWREDVEVL